MNPYQEKQWHMSEIRLEPKTMKDMTPEQIAQAHKDAIAWASNGYATYKHDRCQRCSERYVVPMPTCGNYREHERAAERLTREEVGELVEVGG